MSDASAAPPAPTRAQLERQPKVITFGCRLNTLDSEVIAAHAHDAGLTGAVIVNTCAVTAEASRQARQAVRKARRENPDAAIIVTGCAAQVEPERFAEMPEVTAVIGNEEKLRAETFRSLSASAAPVAVPDFGVSAAEKVIVNDIMSVRETAVHLIDSFEARARAFVQVQTGCDHRCTFCIIPYGRGNSRSVPAGDVVRQVERLVEAGHGEIVLTGVDITSYGHDLPGTPSLGRLVQQILARVPALRRLRLSSIDSIEVDGALMEAITGDTRVMPHLHLSLQAGDDMILKRMKRRHLRGDAIAFCEAVRARRPDVLFGADLIAGFPTETDAMFENSLDLVDACGLTYLHVFPYSQRPGTPAARMPQVAGAAIKERAARLRAKGAAVLERSLKNQVGRTLSVLMEQPGRGRAENFAPVRLETDAAPGTILPVRITGTDGTVLQGEPLSQGEWA